MTFVVELFIRPALEQTWWLVTISYYENTNPSHDVVSRRLTPLKMV